MAHPEQPSSFPPLPDLYPRTDFVPAPAVPMVESLPAVGAAKPATTTGEAVAEATQPSPEHRPKQPYVELTGRVAAQPSFRTTGKTHQLVAQFPLAVHEVQDGEIITTYHTVVAFGARAERVRESLVLGEEIQVKGYKHEGTTKAGKPKIEYYLAALRRPKPPQP